jgi:nucleobindin
LEHFAQHQLIEHKEAEREAKYQGVPVELILKAQENLINAQKSNPDWSQAPFKSIKSVKRVPENQDPQVKFKDAQSEGARKSEWGTGEDGYKTPTEASDKMRLVQSFSYPR